MNSVNIALAKNTLIETLSVIEQETQAVKAGNIALFSSLQDLKRDRLKKLKDVIEQLHGAVRVKNAEPLNDLEKLQEKLHSALKINQSVLVSAENSIKRITERYILSLRKSLQNETPIYTGRGACEQNTGTAPLSLNLNETI